jgi:SAM-dependent MidA family methyltransferase
MTQPAEPGLSELIREQIDRHGPLPFVRFMELALYHERGGYYRRGRDPFGTGGDYFTNSQLQPVFGRLMAQQIGLWREQLGRPEDFSVVELGAGRGEILAELRERLKDVACRAIEYGAREPLGSINGVILSNELFDALPVHSVRKSGGALVEQYVVAGAEGFRFVDGPLSDPRLESYVGRYAPALAEGQSIEVNLAAVEQIERMAAALQRGYVLTIDYGYTSEEIAGARRFPCGSLMSYRGHQASEDVLADPGRRDITAHVNFTALERRGEELGLKALGLRTQAQFLMEIGEADQFASALEACSESDSFRLRMQLKTLLFGLGETFRVLVQKK